MPWEFQEIDPILGLSNLPKGLPVKNRTGLVAVVTGKIGYLVLLIDTGTWFK